MKLIYSNVLQDFLEHNGIGYICKGERNSFNNLSSLEDSNETSLVWIRNKRININDIAANVVICPTELCDLENFGSKTIFFVNNPRLVFTLIANEFFMEKIIDSLGFSENGIHLDLASNSSISQQSKIGKNVNIHPGVVIYPNVIIGDNVEIGSNSVIGSPGFGYVRDEIGRLHRFPHLGGVEIAPSVSIGANTCIDSGGLSPTKIGRGTKIGNFVQIAHNVIIEEDCIVSGKVQIGGGTIIGAASEIWPSVVISNKLKIGRKCDIKIGSVVVTDLNDAASVSGNFAINHTQTMRQFSKAVKLQNKNIIKNHSK